MSWLAIWLIGMGVADLVRGVARPLWVSAASGAGVVVLLGALSGVGEAHEVGVLAAALVPLVAWVWLADRAQRRASGHRRALFALAGGVALLAAFSGWAEPIAGPLGEWLTSLRLAGRGTAGLDATHALLVVGVLLVNIATANMIVRLVLVSIGAVRPIDPARVDPPVGPAAELRGGRLLGPMERLLIVGLGLAGQVTAAGLVIAAKGILRFPELQAKRSDTEEVTGVGIDAVTEYFLVGSFTSWLFALTSLALIR